MIDFPPRLSLAALPTPLTKLSNFKGAPEHVTIWIKHDELTGMEVSGNKIRKLEFCIAHAQQQGCDTLITCGGVQSNHCRATAILGARLGMKVHLILRGEKPAVPDGNLLMDYLSGASITYLTQEQWSDHEHTAKGLQDKYQSEGSKALFIPVGASDEIGLWGYIAAAQELKQDFEKQHIDPEYVVCATGSGGTQGGLIVGSKLFDLKAQCVAFNVSDDADYFEKKIVADINAWKSRYDLEFDLNSIEIKTTEGYLGPGYGVAEQPVFDTIAELAKADGVFLDPVYTGKAFHGMVAELNKGEDGCFPNAKNIVFVHTGGLFGVFPQQAGFSFE
ncbi:MAG: 1-aminocyclopropane-1-carboxylate deaminase/D-cysteine desulfhydrase [Pseudohongiellaceae bacterium]